MLLQVLSVFCRLKSFSFNLTFVACARAVSQGCPCDRCGSRFHQRDGFSRRGRSFRLGLFNPVCLQTRLSFSKMPFLPSLHQRLTLPPLLWCLAFGCQPIRSRVRHVSGWSSDPSQVKLQALCCYPPQVSSSCASTSFCRATNFHSSNPFAHSASTVIKIGQVPRSDKRAPQSAPASLTCCRWPSSLPRGRAQRSFVCTGPHAPTNVVRSASGAVVERSEAPPCQLCSGRPPCRTIGGNEHPRMRFHFSIQHGSLKARQSEARAARLVVSFPVV